MTSTYVTENPTDKDKVRLLISDVGGQDPSSAANFIFDDYEVQTFLVMKGGNVMRAAAMALRSIAGNSIQVMKRITFLELQTDGEAEADILRKLAGELEQQADSGVTFETSHITRDQFNPRGLFETP